jgi:hypothetical protein
MPMPLRTAMALALTPGAWCRLFAGDLLNYEPLQLRVSVLRRLKDAGCASGPTDVPVGTADTNEQ